MQLSTAHGAPVRSDRKLYLDIARVLAIFLVCLNHAVNRSYSNYHGQMAEYLTIPFASTVFKAVCTVASRLGVPLFLMISGVLLLNKTMNSADDIKRFYKHNLLSIFITAEIWYVLMYWFITLGNASSLNVGKSLLGMVKTMLFVDQVTMDCMWYMPMILCLYTTIPFLIIVKDRLSGERLGPIWLLPFVAPYLVTMVLPALNAWLSMNGEPKLEYVVLKDANCISMYYLYLIGGFWIGKGGLSKWRTWLVGLIAIVAFGLCCGMQMYGYSQPAEYLVDYSFPLLPICGAFLFELLRRGAHYFRKIQPAISYIARISFGIYFVHIGIMTVLVKITGDWDMVRPLRLIMYQTVSLVGSVAVIAPLSKIPLLRKYLFMIK